MEEKSTPELSYKSRRTFFAVTATMIGTMVFLTAYGLAIMLYYIKGSGKYNNAGTAFYVGISSAYLVGCIIVNMGIGSCAMGCFHNYLRKNDVSGDNGDDNAASDENVPADISTDTNIALTVHSVPVYDIPIYADPVYRTQMPSNTWTYTPNFTPNYTPNYTFTAQTLSQTPIPLSPVYIPRYTYDG